VALCGSSQSSLAAPKRIGLKSHMRLSGSAAKIVLDHVIRCPNALSAGLKGRLRGLTFAEAPLSAISRFKWSPESAEMRPLYEAPPEDDSSFCADLEQSTPNKNPFMKFVSLRTATHRRGKLDKPSRPTLESFTKPIVGSHQIHSYAALRQQIHDDLRVQHPEWVQPDGKSPICDSYEARLMELLDRFTRTGSNESVADIPRALEQGAGG
jgi:hypothetical protein